MNFVEIKKSDLNKSSLLNQLQKNNPVIVTDVPLYSDTTEEVIYLTESVVEGVVVLDDINQVECEVTRRRKNTLFILWSASLTDKEKEFIDGATGLPLLKKVQEKLDTIFTRNKIDVSYELVETHGLFIHFNNTFLKMKVFEVNSVESNSETLAVKF